MRNFLEKLLPCTDACGEPEFVQKLRASAWELSVALRLAGATTKTATMTTATQEFSNPSG